METVKRSVGVEWASSQRGLRPPPGAAMDAAPRSHGHPGLRRSVAPLSHPFPITTSMAAALKPAATLRVASLLLPAK